MLININKGKLKIGARQGQTLRDAFLVNEIKLGICGGKGVCGKCKVKINRPSEPTDAEKKKLSAEEIGQGFRLACQTQACDGMEIELDEPAFSQKDFSAVCTEITPLTSDIKMFRFSMVAGKTLNYTPGQYVQLTTPKGLADYPSVTRTFSISSDPADKSFFELIIRRTPNGDCTRYLFEKLKTGVELDFMGPDGDFMLTDNDSPMVFIAGGSGMSAIRCLLFEMKRTGCKRNAVYFFGAPSPEGLYMLDEMKDFEKQLNSFKFIPCVQNDLSGQWCGEKGLVTEVVSKVLRDGCNTEAYLCGAPGMIAAAIDVLEKNGIDKSRIYFDSFG